MKRILIRLMAVLGILALLLLSAAGCANQTDGDVILTHDSGKIMHTSIEIFAKWFRDNGYMMVTVDELAHANGVTMQPNEVYYRYLDGDTSKRSDSNT